MSGHYICDSCGYDGDHASYCKYLRPVSEQWKGNLPMTVLNSTVPCKVIPLVNGLNRRGRRGIAEVKPGVMIYYLWHEPTGLFFKECYTNEAYAVRKAMRTTGPRGMSEVAEYWVIGTKYCEHSHRSEDDDDHNRVT